MLNGSISAEDIEYLSRKYDTKNNATVNYSKFINVINKGILFKL